MGLLSCAMCGIGPIGHIVVWVLRNSKKINKPSAILISAGLTGLNFCVITLDLIYLFGDIAPNTIQSGNLIETLFGGILFFGIGFLSTIVHIVWKENQPETPAP